jgi:hypothetical protein
MYGVTWHLRSILPCLAVLALALSVVSVAAAKVPSSAEPGASATAEEAPLSPMSVEFTRKRATLAGPRALVSVRCGGQAAYTCEGTLVLKGVGGAHKVPYSIERGEQRILVVPLGDEDTKVDPGCKAHVVARTLQLTGGTVRTSSVLRIG